MTVPRSFRSASARTPAVAPFLAFLLLPLLLAGSARKATRTTRRERSS